ncbi:MAG: hypothetical protein ACJ8NS_01575 [Chthoniobacterales bacterium]
MSDWWNSLLIEKQIFYAIGIFSLAVLLLQILLTLMGSVITMRISPDTAITIPAWAC